jgi:predicted ATPase
VRDDLPSGTVTFLFTDVEGSTRLLHELGAEEYAAALAEHRRAIREACVAEGGVEVDTQGDAFFFAFPTAPGAFVAASTFTEALASGPIQVRVGLHTGTPLLTEEGYVGDDVHLAARVAAAAHGGQVVISSSTADLVGDGLLYLGEHRLKDVPEAVAIFQLGGAGFPPLKTISNTNLPRPASSFVGREHELSDVLARIGGGVRLLTLTGPGGSGKTRLALEAAASLVPEYKAGVYWVGLASLRDPTLVTETIAQALGAKDGLAEHVGERELLLLLDNLEQVVEAAPELAALLERCPNLTLLVTSRELLRVRGEVEYAVPPLAEPEAVALFCERAQLQPSEEIAELCARLDNLPLAVELAAARTKALSPAQIMERLSQRLDLLKGGRDADPRQQTLRATIEWSYDLLTGEEQRLFARLSVFEGGCTLDAAEEVAEADLDLLQSLVEKSLVRFTNERYWMLETIREYAAERLDASPEADLHLERLARHLIALAIAEGAPLFSQRQAVAFMRLELEHANTRAVMEWALPRRRHEVALELIGWLGQVWLARGHQNEARAWVEEALPHRGAVSESIRARALTAAIDVLKNVGDVQRAVEVAEEVVETMLDRAGVDPLTVASALADLADLAREQGDLDRALEFGERSLEFRMARGLPGARAFTSLAELALNAGDLRRAELLFENGAADYARVGNESNYARAIGDLGEVARRGGDLRRAAGRFTEALHVHLRLGEQAGVGECLQGLALVADARGNRARAARLWASGQALFDAVGASPWRQREIGSLAEEARREGAAMDLDEAVTYALSSLD